MARPIEIIDPEGDKRHRTRRRIVIFACLVSLGLFSVVEGRNYYQRWCSLVAARKLAEYLSSLKTRAILEKQPVEITFHAPDFMEVSAVSTCGPGATRRKIDEKRLGEFRSQVRFVAADWVAKNSESPDPVLSRYCYDPLFGSSLLADGLMRGGIYLAHEQDLVSDAASHIVELRVQGASGELVLE